MKRTHLTSAVRARLTAVDEALATLPDESAVDALALFPAWRPGEKYPVNYRLKYLEKLYRVIQPHTSQEGWEPDKTPALFVEVAKPGEIPVWKQPINAEDAYRTGDEVHYPGKEDPVWVSTVDHNVWTPGVYGWIRKE